MEEGGESSAQRVRARPGHLSKLDRGLLASMINRWLWAEGRADKGGEGRATSGCQRSGDETLELYATNGEAVDTLCNAPCGSDARLCEPS